MTSNTNIGVNKKDEMYRVHKFWTDPGGYSGDHQISWNVFGQPCYRGVRDCLWWSILERRHTDILGRRRSIVYNNVAVQCILSMKPNIWLDKHGAQSVVFGNRDWVTLCGETTKTICLEFRLQDRDLYLEILILNKNEQTNINDGSRQGWSNTQSIKTRSRQMQAWFTDTEGTTPRQHNEA